MLVVIVIVAILLFALLPRFRGHLAKSRDMKRHADLRNIVSAIEMYRSDHRREFPYLEKFNGDYTLGMVFWPASNLSGALSKYMSSIPKDPNKNSLIKVFRKNYNQNRVKKWEYLFNFLRKTKPTTEDRGPHFALLVAKVETPAYANYIVYDYGCEMHRNKKEACMPWCAYINIEWFGPGLRNVPGPIICMKSVPNRPLLCDEVVKADTPNVIEQEDWKIICEYSSEDQLYYFVKIE